jgi:hypothetical protein
VLVVLVASLVNAAPAVAQEDGVFVDPDSPGGKEYAIPLDTQRRQAAPSASTGAAGVEDAPLFGTGITGESGGKATRSSPDGNSERDGSDGADGAVGRNSDIPLATGDARAAVSAATQNPGAPSGGLGAPAFIALLAAAILLVGGLAGWTIRRVRG